MALHFENGMVSTASGADSFIYSDIFVTGAVHWVDSVNGNDANAGTFEEPLATLAQAITNATANNGDVIICKSGHTETVGSTITVSKAGLKIFGMGSGTSRPSFTVNAATDGIDVTGADVELNNLYFPAGTTATNTARINVGAARCRIKNCGFVCGAYDADTITIPDAGDGCEIDSCTFTVSADGPNAGVKVESATALGLKIKNCSFSGGSSAIGWDDGAIYSAVAHTEYEYSAITLTYYSHIIHTAAAKGWCSGVIASDTCYVRV